MRSTPVFQSFPEISLVQREKHTDLDYFWDNNVREDQGGIVIQRTIRGSVAFWDAEGRKEAREGHMLLFRHGENTQYGLDERCDLPYELIWVQLSETPMVVGLYEDLLQSFGPILRMDPKGEASYLLERLSEKKEQGVLRDRFADAEMAFQLLLGIYREQISSRRGRDPIAYGRHLLETQFRSPRNLKEWVAEIGLSREHFTREFQHRFGESPARFLRELRLNHSKNLLLNPGLTVEDVALNSGFVSVKTFHRAFKEYFGVPPSDGRP